MHSDQTIRGNGKWAKISHVRRGRYIIASGWQGDVDCRHKHILSNRDDAMAWARSWINDQ